MEDNTYVRPLIRWWRLIVTVTMLAMLASAVSAYLQPNVYISKTTLIIGSDTQNPNPDYGQFYMAQQLAAFYADMAKREPVQKATMTALGIDWLPQYVSQVVPNTQLVEISVTDVDPERAQIVADELARQLINQTPGNNANNETGARQDFIGQQLSSLQAQILETEKQIEDLQASLVGLASAGQIADIQQQIQSQTNKLNSLRQSYASLLANSQQRAVNILSVVEPANLPTRPSGTSKFLVVALAGLVGFSFGVGAAYLLEYLDRTIKTTSDVERLFHFPVIGYLSQMSENGNNATYVTNHPNSVVAESFRLLQSNLEFFQAYNSAKTILVTSPVQGNGKTTIAVNLALSMAFSQGKVILVDADVRRPAVHAALQIPKTPGLSEVIRNKIKVSDAIRNMKDEKIDVIAVGNVPPNVTEVAGSKRISAILDELREDFDTIIIDAPPLVISDAYTLASKVDGVVLVLEPGQTSEEQAKVIKEQFTRAGANVVGIVFNRVTTGNAKSYGDVQYLSMYSPQQYNDYVSSASKGKRGVSRSKKLVNFFERGEVPEEVEHAITAIKTQPRKFVERLTKPRKNKKNKSS